MVASTGRKGTYVVIKPCPPLEAAAGRGGAGASSIARAELSLDGDGAVDTDGGAALAVRVRFSLAGAVREAFTEEGWTRAYEKYDNTLKLKYGVRLQAGGALKRRTLGKEIDSYRKASIFWTRNPKLVNPMKDKRVWVQVAKNFRPVIRLTEEEVRQELFDFDERITFKASELGGAGGTHAVSAEVRASWQKHDYIGAGSVKARTPELAVSV